jgi:hypothetical protein
MIESTILKKREVLGNYIFRVIDFISGPCIYLQKTAEGVNLLQIKHSNDRHI